MSERFRRLASLASAFKLRTRSLAWAGVAPLGWWRVGERWWKELRGTLKGFDRGPDVGLCAVAAAAERVSGPWLVFLVDAFSLGQSRRRVDEGSASDGGSGRRVRGSAWPDGASWRGRRNWYERQGRTSFPPALGFVGKLRRRPESERFFRLARTAKQAMFVLSSMQRDAARHKKGSSKHRSSFPTRPTPHVPIGKDDERDSREGQRSWQGVSLIQNQ